MSADRWTNPSQPVRWMGQPTHAITGRIIASWTHGSSRNFGNPHRIEDLHGHHRHEDRQGEGGPDDHPPGEVGQLGSVGGLFGFEIGSVALFCLVGRVRGFRLARGDGLALENQGPVDHVHAAGEFVGAGLVRAHINGGLVEGREEPIDAQLREHHAGCAVAVFATVKGESKGESRAGVEHVGLVTALHDDPRLLTV